MSVILVTGGSGFLASHAIVQLLAAGYTVRTTLRSLGRVPEVRSMVEAGGAGAGERLDFVLADLTQDAGWAQAVEGCEFVLHMASPFPVGVPKHEAELIVPAREGALRVLREARDAGVRRVVLTSSFAAIGYGHSAATAMFDETSWTDPAAPVTPYVRSKTLAERAAWEFLAREGGGLELAVINPVAVFGPILGPDLSASLHLIKAMLDGSMPACPRLCFGIVDVRDVADLHLRAMSHPAAAGQRFLATAGDFVSLIGIAAILRREAAGLARRAPTRELPDWLVRLLALVRPELRQVLPELGRLKNGSNARARQVLGWTPRSSEEAVVASAESLARFGLLPP